MIIYISEEYEYDLTQRYRKTQIFRNKSFIAEGCKYFGFDLTVNKIFFNCTNTSSVPLSFSKIDYFLNNNKDFYRKFITYPLSVQVKLIFASNYAFWHFLILLLLVLFFIIILTILRKLYFKRSK